MAEHIDLEAGAPLGLPGGEQTAAVVPASSSTGDKPSPVMSANSVAAKAEWFLLASAAKIRPGLRLRLDRAQEKLAAAKEKVARLELELGYADAVIAEYERAQAALNGAPHD